MKKTVALAVVLAVAASSLYAHSRKGAKHGDCHGGAYIIAQGNTTIVRGCINVGDIGSYKKKFEPPFAWFEEDGDTWLIRDAAWVANAANAFEENGPMKAARKKLMAEEREMERHERELERSAEQIERQIEKIEDEDEMEERHEALKKKHRELEAKAREMEKQAEQMEEAAERMEREFEAVEREAEKKLEKLFEEAIRKGIAKKVN